MESQTGNPMALCITGMGRSGTSLVSSLLQSGGLNIGKRLMGAGTGNVKGHFEDLDFYEFHVEVFESQGIHSSGFTVQPEIPVREQHLLRARELIRDRRRRPGPWGWKDPRSTLFLDFWQQLLPEANFLFLYRPPWDVVDSLFRRGDPVFRSNPCFAVKVWIHYNRLLLAFYDRFPNRCLVAHSYRAAQSPSLLLEALSKKFGLKLGNAGDLFEESLLRHRDSSRWASLLQHHFPEAADLYEALNERARKETPDASLAGQAGQFVPLEDWAFHDWLDLRALEGRDREERTLLEQSEKALSMAHTNLVAARDREEQLQSQLRQTEAALSQARGELAQAQAHLLQAQAILARTQADLSQVESSKFWKLREVWFRFKGTMRRAS
jgi:hypothetical protein